MPDASPTGPEAGDARFLTFRAAGQLYALPADEVAEVIRTPTVARVPQGPRGLLGLANLRGAVMPVASLRGLLGQPEAAASTQARTIVLHGATPAGLAVDAVEALVRSSAVETRTSEIAAPTERLRGAFRAGGDEVAKVLDLQALLEAAFTARPRARRAVTIEASGPLAEASTTDQTVRLVAFEVAGQAFAMALDEVQEIVAAPASIASTPHADAALLGVTAYRETLLPVMSLRALLGFAPEALDGRAKLLVVAVSGGRVGLLADRMQEIVAAAPELIEPAPAMLAARTGGESRIRALYRGDGGRRLISILSADQLFREDVMQRLGATTVETQGGEPAAAAQMQHLVFRLGDDEFALPIAAVVEVARVPAQITRVPKTPKFLEGVINLRGEVLPVIDQRRRFDMPPLTAGENRRLVVVRTERHRAGLIVDSVSDVLRTPADGLDEAPDLPGEANRLVNGVIARDGRMVLVLDPAELLTRAERGMLDAFAAEADQETR